MASWARAPAGAPGPGGWRASWHRWAFIMCLRAVLQGRRYRWMRLWAVQCAAVPVAERRAPAALLCRTCPARQPCCACATRFGRSPAAHTAAPRLLPLHTSPGPEGQRGSGQGHRWRQLLRSAHQVWPSGAVGPAPRRRGPVGTSSRRPGRRRSAPGWQRPPPPRRPPRAAACGFNSRRQRSRRSRPSSSSRRLQRENAV